MNLADRIRGVLGPSRRADSPVGGASPRDWRYEPVSAGGGAEPVSPVDALGGEWCKRSSGRSFVVERTLAGDELFRGRRVDHFADAIESGLTRASQFIGRAPARQPLVFFDLETTGLSGGAGTFAFLVGCGWFDAAGAFVTRQYLLHDFEDERPMLEAVSEELSRAGVLVSYNGKSFDSPVLEGRYALHRLPWVGGALPHFDVLHPARRFWGGASDEGCSLGTLERRLVGVIRHDDVPGFEIPARYFQFVRSGNALPLVNVFNHNRQDLVSLALITGQLLYLLEQGAEAAGDAYEALALGAVYASAGWPDRAGDAYHRALDLAGNADGEASSADRDAKAAALRALAVAARRRRDFEAAARYWRQLLDIPGCPRREAGEAATALAVHHEHRARDLASAKMFALKSLARDERPAWREAVRHRLARLERKIDGLNEPRLFPSLSSRPSSGSPKSERRISS
jgi:uncharacterized protein YprB with RNaseH-like and TPR domain